MVDRQCPVCCGFSLTILCGKEFQAVHHEVQSMHSNFPRSHSEQLPSCIKTLVHWFPIPLSQLLQLSDIWIYGSGARWILKQVRFKYYLHCLLTVCPWQGNFLQASFLSSVYEGLSFGIIFKIPKIYVTLSPWYVVTIPQMVNDDEYT